MPVVGTRRRVAIFGGKPEMAKKKVKVYKPKFTDNFASQVVVENKMSGICKWVGIIQQVLYD